MDWHVFRVISLAVAGFVLFIAALPLLWIGIYKWTLLVMNMAGVP